MRKIGKEKKKLAEGHPERLPRQLEWSEKGRWLAVPQGPGFEGKYPKFSVPMRVEPYRESKEDTDEDAKEACAYAKDARNANCWYSYEEWRKHFKGYEEPKKEECSFMNGELFSNKIIVGRWGKDEEDDEEEDTDGEKKQEDYRYSRGGYRGGNRGRGWSGYGRGQNRNYEEEEYQQRRWNNEGAPWVEGQRGRGRGYRARGGRMGNRGY